MNQTGGLPPLLLGVLNAVLARTADGAVTAEVVRAGADAAFESVRDFLAASWNDCTEALARACAELLEGEWAQAYLRGEYLPQEGKLWPSQRQGIAQALYILTRRGSVLIADAAGSGKTRMGIHLMGAVADHNLRVGRMSTYGSRSESGCCPIKDWQPAAENT